MEDPKTVLISYSPLGRSTRRTSQGFSGISIGGEWLLTHGTILAPVFRLVRGFLANLEPGKLTPIPKELEKQFNVFVYRELELPTSSNQTTRLSTMTDTPETASGIKVIPSAIVAVWKCPLLEETFQKLFRHWNFTWSNECDRSLLSIFLVIRQGGCKDYEGQMSSMMAALSRLEQQTLPESPIRGTTAEIVSTPFGNPVFFDSVTRGVIGNVLGSQRCVLLTDANTFPGCEGSALYVLNDRLNADCTLPCSYDSATYEDFTKDRRRICGMVVARSSFCREERVDYTLAVNFSPILRRLIQQGQQKPPPPSLLSNNSPSGAVMNFTDDDAGGHLDRSITMVKCGESWGTGIFVDEPTGTLLTCAHVVAEAPLRDISITARQNDSEICARAKLVYRSPENKPYDIAVLRVEGDLAKLPFRAIKLASGVVYRGEQVLSAGFPFFSSSNPTISSGVVTKSLNCMLQTSCCVQSGNSGGPIVRRKNHEMIGMVVCNAMVANDSVLYPRLSMAIPVTVFKEALSEYLRTADPAVLETLTENDLGVQRIWELQPFLFSNM